MTNKLDLTSLVKALSYLQEAIDAYQQQSENKFIRDASIQRFEYTYELCHKMLKRYLEMSEASAEEIDEMSFPNLIRTGAERGLLLHSWDKWESYRYARNLTSHTYDESKALEVVKTLPAFANEARFLLQKLQERMSNA